MIYETAYRLYRLCGKTEELKHVRAGAIETMDETSRQMIEMEREIGNCE